MLRYQREFLLQFQHGKDVSTTPIKLPEIPDIYPNKSKKQNTYKHYKSMGPEKNMTEHYMEDETPDHKEERFLIGLQSMEEEDDKLQSTETFEYNDTCYIVVDYDGINDDLDEESNLINDNLRSKSEENSLLEYEKDNIHEKNAISKRAKQQTMTNCHRKDRKRHADAYNLSEKIYHKRHKRTSFHKDGERKKKLWKRYMSKNHKRNIDKHFKGPIEGIRPIILNDVPRNVSIFSRINVESHNTQRQQKYPEKEENALGKQSEHCRPLLFENGLCIQTEPNEATNEIPEHQEQRLSPVSDRSLSPYADLQKSLDNNEKGMNGFENIGNGPETVKCLQNKAKVIESANKQMFQDSRKVMRSNKQTTFANGVYFENSPLQNRTVPYGYNRCDQAYCRMPYPIQPVFQYGNSIPFYPNLNAPFVPPFAQNAPYASPSFQNYVQESDKDTNHMHFRGRGRQNRNNIVVTQSMPVQNDKTEYYWISAENVNILSIEVKNKIVTSIYRAMVRSEPLVFSPLEILEMAKQCTQINVGFDSKSTLLYFLKSYENKFLLQNMDMISPKVDIKLCPAFTNDPCLRHECFDLHLCKYYLLGCCTVENCKFSHNLNSGHNVKVLQCHDLWKIDERHIKRLLQNLNNRNISTTPLVCKFYNNQGGCQRDVCMHLHVCTHFINDDCKFLSKCKRSHNFNDKQVRDVLEKHGILPDESNCDKIRNLLKATLTDGEVKLKRELSKFLKPNADFYTNVSNQVKNRSGVQKTVTSDTNERTDSVEDVKIDKNVKRISLQNNFAIHDVKHTERPNDPTIKECCENEMTTLPDYIPLHTFSSPKEEVLNSNDSETDLTGYLKKEEKEVEAEIHNDLKQLEYVLKQDPSIKSTGQSNESDPNTSVPSKISLPSWKSLLNKVANKNVKIDKDTGAKENDATIQTEADTVRLTVDSSEKKMNCSLNNDIDEENQDETSIVRQLDTEVIGENCALIENNELQSNTSESGPKIIASLGIEFESGSRHYRARKNADMWQIREEATPKTDNETIEVCGEQPWKNIPEEEADKLNNLYIVFSNIIAKT